MSIHDFAAGKGLRRRTILGAGAGLAVPFIARRAWADDAIPSSAVLRVGDQKGGVQALLRAADGLRGAPYRVDWKQFVAAAPLLEALNAGAVDCAYAGDAPTTFALAAGLTGRIIAVIRGTGASTAIVVPAESPIHTVADLKGRTFGTNRGSIGHALVLAVAEQQGWASSDYRIANLMPGDAKAALAVGSVDAWSTWGVFVAQAQLADGARVIVDGRDRLLSGMSYQVATDQAIAEKRPILLDFCRRVAKARIWARDHPDDYAAGLAAEIGVSQPVAKLTFETEIPLPVPIDDQVVADEQKTADRYVRAGIIPRRLDAAAAFDRSFNEAFVG